MSSDLGATNETFGGVHGDGAHGVFAEMLRHFQDQPLAIVVVSSAFRIAGRWPSNVTSTTAPITWLTRPTEVPDIGAVALAAFAALAIFCFVFLRALPRPK